MKQSDKIKLARKAKGLTQKELATKTGMSQATINKLESEGEKAILSPSFELAVKIASVLDTDVFELFGDESLKKLYPNVSHNKIEQLKHLVFFCLDDYTSNQLFFKATSYGVFDGNDDDLNSHEEFNSYMKMLVETKNGILQTLMNFGFCTQEDIKNFHSNPNMDFNKIQEYNLAAKRDSPLNVEDQKLVSPGPS